ncbi:AI-2E family transporter [Gilvimarinus sp. F26214L]|uniref:AI-2E family transporter n=1 Tax=Gilvimarinus sp. DZF01 TaxID=3461371 RepID=UPI004045EB0E
MAEDGSHDTHGEPQDPVIAADPLATRSPVSWVRRLQDQSETNRVIVVLLFLIVLIMAFYFVQAAALLLVPIVFSWLLSTLFHPVVHYASRLKIPPVLTAGVIVALTVGGFALLALLVMDPALQWVRDLPETLQRLRAQLMSVEGALSELKEVTREVGELAELDEDESEAIEVQIAEENVLRDAVIGYLPSLVTATAIVVFLTFFLLATGDQMLRKITRLGPTWSTRRRIVSTVHRIRAGVAHYLATVTVINITLGVVVTIAMHLLEVPNPLLWGMVAGVLNFAPYLGPAVTLVILGLVGISTFDTLTAAMAVPLVFLVLTVLEGQLITPMVVGRRLAMSPATVFVSVVVWGWLWGVAGALMAVPIVASLKIIFENVPPLEGLAKTLERS